MKQFDYMKRERASERAREEKSGRSESRRDLSIDVAEAMHRAGPELPVRLAELRASSPERYRQTLQALQLGPLGTRRLDEQISLLAASSDQDIAAELRRRRAASEGLDPGLRARAERSLGVGLDHVRVFHGPAAESIAQRHGAAAFAWGHSIVLGRGVRNVPSPVMAEEVAHVAQQRGATAGPLTVTPASAPAEHSARTATSHILAGRRANVGRVGARSIMRVARDSVSEEERNPQDLSPQFGSMEARSDEDLAKIVNDDKGQPRYAKRGYLYEPQSAGAITLELWLAAFDEVQKRNKGPRGKEEDKAEGGEAHMVDGHSYAPDVAVQKKAAGPAMGGLNVHSTARSGLRGGGQPLPYLTRLQRSFGRHDLAGVRAHVGGSAVLAGQQLGARAYAMGEQVAFAQTPDLHTAAHEAAHVIQQRQGVSLPDGVGQAGDAYESHADRVADTVVRGESAEGLLGATRVASASGGLVQRKEDERDLFGASAGRGKQQASSTIRWDVTILGTPVTLKLKRTLKRGKGEPKPPGADINVGVKVGEVGHETETKAIDQSITNALKAKFASVSLDGILGADDRGDTLKLSAKLAFGDAKVTDGKAALHLATLELSLKGSLVVPQGEFELAGSGKVTLPVAALGDAIKDVFEHVRKLDDLAVRLAPDQQALSGLLGKIEERKTALREKFKGQGKRLRRDKLLREMVHKAGALKQKLNAARRKLGPTSQRLQTAIAKVRAKFGEKVAHELSQRAAKTLAKLIPGLNLVMFVWDAAEIIAWAIDTSQRLTLDAQFGGVSQGQGNAKSEGERDAITQGQGQDEGETYRSDQDDPDGGTHGGRPGENEVQGQGDPDGKAVDAGGGPNELEGTKGDWLHWVYSVNASGGQLRIRVHKGMAAFRKGPLAQLKAGKGTFTVLTTDGPVKFGGKPAEFEEGDEYILIVLNGIRKKGGGTGGTGGTQTQGGGGGTTPGPSYEGADGRRQNGADGGPAAGRDKGTTDAGADTPAGPDDAPLGGEARQEARDRLQEQLDQALARGEKSEAGQRGEKSEAGQRGRFAPIVPPFTPVNEQDGKDDEAESNRVLLAMLKVKKSDTRESLAARAIRQFFPNASQKQAAAAVAELNLPIRRQLVDADRDGAVPVPIYIDSSDFEKLKARLGKSSGSP